MKKFVLLAFILLSLSSYTEEKTNVIKQEVSGMNKQQLDVRDITTEELILRNQNLESTSIDISGQNFKEKDDKIKIKKSSNENLKEELSKGLKKSFFGLFD